MQRQRRISGCLSLISAKVSSDSSQARGSPGPDIPTIDSFPHFNKKESVFSAAYSGDKMTADIPGKTSFILDGQTCLSQ